MANSKWKHALTNIGNMIFVLGGVRGSYSVKDWQKYDSLSDEWDFVPSLT